MPYGHNKKSVTAFITNPSKDFAINVEYKQNMFYFFEQLLKIL
jgi:hypothetical protein